MTSALDLAVRGFVVGLAIAASVGPIWMVCLRRTLDGGFAAGLASGAGAAVADGLYGAVGALGVDALGRAIEGIAPWLGVGGGLFLIGLGLSDLARRAPERAATAPPGLLKGFATTFALTLANPMTILSFAAVFAGLGVGGGGAGLGALVVVAGVFTGSLAWWLVLAGGATWLRDRLDRTVRHWITRVSALVLIGFGVAALWRSL